MRNTYPLSIHFCSFEIHFWTIRIVYSFSAFRVPLHNFSGCSFFNFFKFFVFLVYLKYTIGQLINVCKLNGTYISILVLWLQCYAFIFYLVYCILWVSDCYTFSSFLSIDLVHYDAWFPQLNILWGFSLHSIIQSY